MLLLAPRLQMHGPSVTCQTPWTVGLHFSLLPPLVQRVHRPFVPATSASKRETICQRARKCQQRSKHLAFSRRPTSVLGCNELLDCTCTESLGLHRGAREDILCCVEYSRRVFVHLKSVRLPVERTSAISTRQRTRDRRLPG